MNPKKRRRVGAAYSGIKKKKKRILCEPCCLHTKLDIEQHASDNVNKIPVGNKADMDEGKRAVPTSKGQALADEYGIKFFETQPASLKINPQDPASGSGHGAQKSSCCGS